MNAIIIEDEYLAAAELERLLGEVAPEITILTKLEIRDGGGCCLFHGGRKVSGTFHP